RLIVDQLQGIGGSRSVGMGPNRVTSLPDAVANAIIDNYFPKDEPRQLTLPMAQEAAAPQTGYAENGHSDSLPFGVMSGADVCPSCATVSLIRAEGCRKCLTCGYSEC